MYQISVHQALSTLEQVSSDEAHTLPEGLTYAQLKVMRDMVESAQYILGKLHRAVEQNMGWLEEAQSDNELATYQQAA